MHHTLKADDTSSLELDLDLDCADDAPALIIPKFNVTPALAGCGVLDGRADTWECARLLAKAGFTCVPLGGLAVDRMLYTEPRQAEAYAAAVGGNVVAMRFDQSEGQYDCRITRPLGTKGDRTKLPCVGAWQKLPYSEDWWTPGALISANDNTYRGNPRRNVGVRTGEGLVVIDVDRKDGRDGLAALHEMFGDRFSELFPDTFTVTTPTGGLHWYYECDQDVHNSAGKLAKGVDVRGAGGMVVGPGSVRLDGRGYEITSLVPLAKLPAETLAHLRTLTPARLADFEDDDDVAWDTKGSPAKEAVLESIIDRYPAPASGVRHQTLLSVAGRARNQLASDEDLEWVIREYANAHDLARRDPQDLEAIIASAKQMTRKPPRLPRRTIVVGPDESRMVEELEAAFAASSDVFCRAGRLWRPGRDGEATCLLPVAKAELRTESTKYVDWVKLVTKDGVATQQPTNPVPIVVESLHARQAWRKIRQVQLVTAFPVMRVDGTVATGPGYDAASETYITAGIVTTLPDKPTRDDAVRAVNELSEIFCDFPLDGELARVAVLAALLTPIARPMIRYSGVPLMVVDKNVRGAGSGLLVDAIGTCLTGAPPSKKAQAPNDEEDEKRILGDVLRAVPMVVIDNVARPLGSPALDAALTTARYEGRVLGVTGTVSARNTVTFYATGNNIAFAGDTSRRALRIRMESPHENPEERTDFKHPDLMKWIRVERPRLLAAALTVLRAYAAAGRPDVGLKPWGSFAEWSDAVRAPLVWLGLRDPGDARGSAFDALDESKQELLGVLEGIEEVTGGSAMLAKDILARLDADPTCANGLRETLYDRKTGKLLSARAAARWVFNRHKGRVVNGRRLVSVEGHAGKLLWRVETVDGVSLGAGSGDAPPDSKLVAPTWDIP